MLKRFRVVAILLVLTAIVAGTVGAITWGEPDGNRHPHVVALLFERPDGLYSCSGTLLTPYVVLTAGHCTEELGQVNINTWVRNDADIDTAYATERPNYSSTRAWLNATWITGTAVPHPNYNDFAGFPNTHDVGVVLLSQPIYVPVYGQLPTLNQFDALAKGRGSTTDRQFTIVGYGRQELLPVIAPKDDWERYMGQTTFINVDNQYTAGYNFQFTNNPGTGTGGEGTCNGDSGGPAFWGTTNIIAAVTSYGITPHCNGIDFSYRADIAETLSFVTPYLSWTPQSGGGRRNK
jgi:hypothetical protein